MLKEPQILISVGLYLLSGASAVAIIQQPIATNTIDISVSLIFFFLLEAMLMGCIIGSFGNKNK
jgi:hypothetical protein